MQVARKLYTSSSERCSVDTTDLALEGSAYGRHVYMSYGQTVARAIREGYGPSVPSFRDQVALQRAFHSPYTQHIKDCHFWKWEQKLKGEKKISHSIETMSFYRKDLLM